MVEMELVEMAAEFDEVGMGRTDVDGGGGGRKWDGEHGLVDGGGGRGNLGLIQK